MRLENVWKDIPFNHIIDLYNSVGWSVYTKDIHELKKAFNHSSYVVLAFEGDQLVGLARTVSDFVSINYVQDLLVTPSRQNNGVGRALMQNVLERFSGVRTQLLMTDDEEKQLKFYESMGYKNTKELNDVPLNTFVKMRGIELK